MEYNVDILRNIILSIAENLEPDEYGDVEEIETLEFVRESLSNYPQNEALYWIRQLMESGIVIPGKKYVDEPMSNIKDLSINGYQFVNSIKNPSIWEKIKPKLLDTAISSIPALVEKVISLSVLPFIQ